MWPLAWIFLLQGGESVANLQDARAELHQEIVSLSCSQEEEPTPLACRKLQVELDSAVRIHQGHLHVAVAKERC